MGNGVGLFQGQGLDDYADDQTLAELRARDEKEDWLRIPIEHLNECGSSLSFFDPEGMRFHLPAFLIADLEDMLWQDVRFHLTYLPPHELSRFSLLSESQREAVRQYLSLPLPEGNEEYERPMIDEAMADYWSKPQH